MAVKIENGVIVGTTSKYELKNPIVRFLIQQFDDAVVSFVKQVQPKTVFEVGAGEGHITQLVHDHTNATITATDISQRMIDEAKKALVSPRVKFEVMNALELKPQQVAPELVVCCEVMEHLTDPQKGLDALVALNAEWYLISVPREPIWCLLNMIRGRYWTTFGNTPGHLQHWSKRSFLRFLSTRLTIVDVKSPLPWTVVLCRR